MASRKKKQAEKSVHQQLCDYIKYQYPKVVFTSDASGLRVSMGLRMELKRKRSNDKIPDLLILHPSGNYHGLLIEVKRNIGEVYKKDLSYVKDEHIEDQAATLEKLNAVGYKAVFGCGFDHSKQIIDEYLKDC